MMLTKCLIQWLIEILPNPWIVSDWWLMMVVILIITHMLVLYRLVFSLGDAIASKEIHGSIYRHGPWARVEWQRLGCKCIPLSSNVDLDLTILLWQHWYIFMWSVENWAMLVWHFWRWRWTSHSCRLGLP